MTNQESYIALDLSVLNTITTKEQRDETAGLIGYLTKSPEVIDAITNGDTQDVADVFNTLLAHENFFFTCTVNEDNMFEVKLEHGSAEEAEVEDEFLPLVVNFSDIQDHGVLSDSFLNDAISEILAFVPDAIEGTEEAYVAIKEDILEALDDLLHDHCYESSNLLVRFTLEDTEDDEGLTLIIELHGVTDELGPVLHELIDPDWDEISDLLYAQPVSNISVDMAGILELADTDLFASKQEFLVALIQQASGEL